MVDNEILYSKSTDKCIQFPKYSFPKEKRFVQQNLNLCDKLYDLPKALSQRGTSMGYGKKITFGENIVSPGPGTYKVSKEILKSNGVIMGLGRENISINSFFGKSNNQVGPGQYNNNKSTISKIAYSITGKPLDVKQDQTPGPGAYKQQSIDLNGKHLLSTNKNNASVVINKQNNSIFSIVKNQNPGIGSYNIDIIKDNTKGVYIQSNFKSIQGKSFAHKERKTIDINSISPGPGAYKLPCLFG